MLTRRTVGLAGWSTAIATLILACGSRTGLLVPDDAAAPVDAAPDLRKPDARDATPPVEEDAAPALDVVRLDAYQTDCPDASGTLVYVVTEDNQLLSFYPPTASFRAIGALACPARGAARPFSMAVDRKGTAYVLYNDGEIFKVSTANASCQPTAYVPGQSGITTFGMGFATLGAGPAEGLFIASDQNTGSVLGVIDTTTLKLGTVGPITPSVVQAELTGTGDGRLYAFVAQGNGSAIAELDRATANVLGVDAIPNVSQGSGWAFAFWGGSFYLFTGPNGTQTTWQYDPATKKATAIANFSSLIVGAGVSTCAPQ